MIISSSIYLGKIQKAVTKFCESNLEKFLKVHRLGLFICCDNDEKDMEQLANFFPDNLIEKA